MDHLASTVIARMAHLNGIITADDFTELAISSDRVVRWLRGGQLVKARRGAYVEGDLWRSLDETARARVQARASVRRLTHCGGLVGSARTAAVIHGLPTLGTCTTVSLARTGEGPSEHAADVRIQTCWGPGSQDRIEGVPVLRLAATVVSLAATHGLDAGVVAADAALHAGLLKPSDLNDWMTPNIGRRGIRAARDAIRLADPKCESPGESLTRLALIGFGLPWRSQAGISTDTGPYRVDFLVGERVVVEFDGAVKYAGRDGQAALIQEKRREDSLRRAGYLIIRITWADLHDPKRLRQLLGPALRLSEVA